MQVRARDNKIINRLEKTRIEKFPDFEKEKIQAEKEKRRIAREAMNAKVNYKIQNWIIILLIYLLTYFHLILFFRNKKSFV